MSFIVIGTQNVLYPQPPAYSGEVPERASPFGYDKGEDGMMHENWVRRKAVHLNNFSQALPDILCLQEVTWRVFEDFQHTLCLIGYALQYQCHPTSGHGVAIAWKNSRFGLLHAHTGSFAYGSQTRAHLVVRLMELTTKKTVQVACCHLFDPRDLTDKKSHIQAVATTLSQFKADLSAVAGDFNQDQYGDLAQGEDESAPRPRKKCSLISYLKGRRFKCAPFVKTTERGKERHIDHIFVQGRTPEYVEVPTDPSASDHLYFSVKVQL
ncbi:MAG: endonuclease/exonuclease/phosphatase family protein [Chlamydiia bacterium]|nr:endonuclease/exonuclease/phosphatase family protein [Chlamydiia bacterium]